MISYTLHKYIWIEEINQQNEPPLVPRLMQVDLFDLFIAF